MLSLGMDCARAAITAERSRAFIVTSGRPAFAATVISRLSLEKSEERFLSCAPLRYMMFLYLEWPAIAPVLVWVCRSPSPAARAVQPSPSAALYVSSSASASSRACFSIFLSRTMERIVLVS